MKKFLLSSFLISVLLSSCSVWVMEATTTHKQVMETYKTKEQIVKKFGLPTSKKSEGEYEEWFFDYGTKTVTDAAGVGSAYSGTRSAANTSGAGVTGYTPGGNIGTLAAVSGLARSNTAATASTRSRTVTQELKTFIKFTLKDDKVVLWESSGLDYGVYEKVKKKISQLQVQ